MATRNSGPEPAPGHHLVFKTLFPGSLMNKIPGRFLISFCLIFSQRLMAENPFALSTGLDLPIIGSGALLSYNSSKMLAGARKDSLNISALNRRSINPLDRWAIGYYSPTLSSVSGALSAAELLVPAATNLWDISRDRQAWYAALMDVVMYEEAITISSSLSSYAKVLRFHSTPLTYSSDVPMNVRRDPVNVSSFFSGHATAAFTTAVFSGYTFQAKHPGSPLVPWVWGGSLAAATGVSVMRVLAGKHFPSDVLMGAAAGSAIGFLVPWLHTRIWALPAAHGMGQAQKKPGGIQLEMGLTGISGSDIPVPTLSMHF